MKRLKLNFALLAMVLGLSAAFAFKPAEAKTRSKLTFYWFVYNGGGTTNPANYSIVSSDPMCPGSDNLCAIEGNENGSTGHPTQASVNSPTKSEYQN